MSHRKYWAVSKGKKDMGRKKDTHTHTHTHTHREGDREKAKWTNRTQHRAEVSISPCSQFLSSLFGWEIVKYLNFPINYLK